MHQKSKTLLGKLLYWLVLLGFVYFISQQLTELESVASALREGKKLYLVLAFLFQLFYHIFLTKLGLNYLNKLDTHINFAKLLGINVASNFLNVSTPGAASVGLAYQVRKVANISGKGMNRVLVAYLSVLTTQYLSFLLIVTWVVWYLFSNNQPYGTTLAAGFTFLLINFALVFGYYVFLKFPQKMVSLDASRSFWGKVLRFLILRVKKDYTHEWLEEKVLRLSVNIRVLLSHEYALISGFVSGLMLHVINIVTLYYVFLAFNVGFSLELLVASYCTFYLFTVVSPTPQGIGIVEGVVQVFMTRFGVAPETALLSVLSYRALTLWIPILLGFLSFRLVEGKSLLLKFRR